jgi:nucleotide-binding universal stress UspA family protein
MMAEFRKGPIVVGIDGSDTSLAALRWAAGESRARRRRLRLVHGFVWPSAVSGYGLLPQDWFDPQPRGQVDRLMSEWVALAQDMAGDVLVTGEVVNGPPAAVLIAESRDASAVVIGTRGGGGFVGLLLGSVATQVATYAHGPVVVIPPTHDQQRAQGLHLVVGMDGSEAADRAAGYAFEVAAARNVELMAVRAWTPPKPPWRTDTRPLVLDVDEIATSELAVLRASLAPWKSAYPSVHVEEHLVAERPANALVAASGGAQLLVVGSRGLGGLRGRLLGSVSMRVLQHARCAVAVVHSDGVQAASDHAITVEASSA